MDLLLTLEFQRRFIRLLALKSVYSPLLNDDGIRLIEGLLFSTYVDLRDLGEGAWAQEYLEAGQSKAVDDYSRKLRCSGWSRGSR